MADWVLNASPIIALSRLGLLEVFELLIPGAIVPSGVVEEIVAGTPNNPAAAWLSSTNKGRVVDVPVINAVVAGWDLGKGESEVLTWAYERNGAGAVLDDGAARRCANTLGVPLRGTVGLLVLARRRGLFADIESILEELPRIGFRISPALANEAKRLARA